MSIEIEIWDHAELGAASPSGRNGIAEPGTRFLDWWRRRHPR